MRLALVLLAGLVLALAGCSSSSGPTGGDDPPYPDIPGLVVFYEFDGDLENEVADEHHGTASRAVTYVADRDGGANGAIHVDKYDVVSVPDHPELDITGGVTLAAWVSPEASDQAHASLIDKGHNEAYSVGMWGGISDPDTTLFFGYIADESENSPYLLPMGTGVWSHIAITFDDTANRMRLYFNGSKVDSGNIGTSIGVTDQPLRIGGSQPAGFYKGRIDEVAVFDRALTHEEIEELYQFD